MTEDPNLAKLDALAAGVTALDPYAFGQLRTFLDSLPVEEVERLRDIVDAR